MKVVKGLPEPPEATREARGNGDGMIVTIGTKGRCKASVQAFAEYFEN